MSLSLTSSNRAAFESLTDGLRAMQRYYDTRDVSDIEEAAQRIDAAISLDKHYGLAVFYKGVVLDLIGTPADAPQYFERILNECTEPDLEVETKFNLGVVYYHRYSYPFLAQAESYFKEVIAQSGDEKLKRLAQAHLAQTHAMWMRPRSTQNPKDPQVIKHSQDHFAECKTLVDALQKAKSNEPRVIAAYNNAWGMANMYYTDNIAATPDDKHAHLDSAKGALQAADKVVPNDWANTCDLGSLQLRFAALERECGSPQETIDGHFSSAKQLLLKVVDTLRPGYGFALYELGILHRVWAKWEEAEEFFNRAKQVPDKYRDISATGVEKEHKRAQKKDSSYP